MKVHNHFKTVCIKCRTVISQCRCISKNKSVLRTICDKCNELPKVEKAEKKTTKKVKK